MGAHVQIILMPDAARRAAKALGIPWYRRGAFKGPTFRDPAYATCKEGMYSVRPVEGGPIYRYPLHTIARVKAWAD